MPQNILRACLLLNFYRSDFICAWPIAESHSLDQNTLRQEIAMKEVGVDYVFIEKASGKNADRPELKKMLSYVRNGDVLYIESISRLPGVSKTF